MLRYLLTDFNDILKDGVVNKLPEETVDLINMLAAQVGAPEYIKTPQFKNKTLINGNGNGPGNVIRRRKKFQEIDDDEWQNMRAFQTTELKKTEGVEANLFTIRKFLNMLTSNTYDKVYEDIIEEINIVLTTKTPNDLSFLCNELFNIIIGNILYSDIYAKLYKELVTKFSIFNDILVKNLSQFENKINNIQYCDPDDDYNKFCENNKSNEYLRSISSFYINLMKEGLIEKDVICNIILKLCTIVDSMISDGTKKNELDELSELVYIMIVNSYKLIKLDNPDIAKQIIDHVSLITKIKMKERPGITNKCIFKHMDILDEICA